MITDDERREVAAKMREVAESHKDDLNDDPDYSPFVAFNVFSSAFDRFPCYKDLLHLADLIDRPTCKIILESKLHTAYGEPINGLNAYVLSCGHQTVGLEKPRYCPKCGLVVSDD